MNKCVKITFQPIIWRDENLNNASAGIGSTTCHVFGETKEQLFENIKQKIWAMSSEARILDEEVAAITSGLPTVGRQRAYRQKSRTWECGICAMPSPTPKSSNNGSENTTDMVNINGFDFYEEPGICGTCPFLITGNTSVPGISCHSDRGLCIQWNEAHHTWANIPRRCKKLFKSAFALYNDSGETLVITKKE